MSFKTVHIALIACEVSNRKYDCTRKIPKLARKIVIIGDSRQGSRM